MLLDVTNIRPYALSNVYQINHCPEALNSSTFFANFLQIHTHMHSTPIEPRC